jgi:restriction system protein
VSDAHLEALGRRVRSPLMPTWAEVRTLLRIWAGVPRSTQDDMHRDIIEQRGTPQAQVDWSNPDEWIAGRLAGKSQALAHRIWTESKKTVNPRHTYGSMLFTRLHQLIATDEHGINRVTDRGASFLQPGSAVEREIDEIEGLFHLAQLIAKHSRPRRQDLLPEWAAYLKRTSKFGTPATIKSTLAYRVRNLVERGLVERDGLAYVLTPAGQRYAASTQNDPQEQDDRQQLLDAVEAFNTTQRRRLRELLATMHPFAFEHMVRDLLDAMGYEDATVTKQSGDKGIDVVATVQVGITTVQEVVQVKRVQGNLNRTVLDQLRGVLPFHRAIRGTIITLGGFSKGCTEVATFAGAAPLTLIDGHRLLDLMIEHGVGITKESVVLYEIGELSAIDGPEGLETSDEIA